LEGSEKTMSNFFSEMNDAAAIASDLTDIPKEVILAQWALESAFGTSDLSKRANNYAGIKSSSKGKDFVSGSYAGYNSKDSFARDYARVMNLSYYDKVREAKGVNETIDELAKSPYAEDTSYGDKLKKVLGDMSGISLPDVAAAAGKINFFGWAIGLFVVWFFFWR
jgi:flagellum-specific peptidoglycan hydrolase FlgJ